MADQNPALQTLKIDDKYRYEGVEDDLHPIHTLNFQQWHYQYPTIEKKCARSDEFVLKPLVDIAFAQDINAFKAKLDKECALFKNINFDNLCIAGSFVGSLITGKKTYADIDVFVYGTDVQGANDTVHRFVSQLLHQAWEIDNQGAIQKNDKILQDFENLLQSQYTLLLEKYEDIKTSKKFAKTSEIYQEEVEKTHQKSLEQYRADLRHFEKVKRQEQKLRHFSKPSHHYGTRQLINHNDPQAKPINLRTYDDPCFTFMRNSKAMSIDLLHSPKIQIIFRLYHSVSEILHGFDLGSSAVGFDGQQVWMTTLGKFAYEYGYNILDTTRRSTTYERRLQKYWERGFGIILPQLDIDKLRSDYFRFNYPEIILMPYLAVIYKDLQGNRIFAQELIVEKGVKCASDYSGEFENVYQTFFANVRNLANDVYDFFHFIEETETADARQLLSTPPNLHEKHIIDFYDNLADNIIQDGKFCYGKTRKFITHESFDTIIRHLFVDLSTEQEREEYIKALLEKQKTLLLEKWAILQSKDYASIDWITENPGKQLTSSLNPIIRDPEEWYGAQYFLPAH